MSSTSSSDGSTSPLDSGYSSSSCLDATGEVYVPAPVHAKGDEAFNWHITTRNLFAWMHDKPIVGPTLGKAMVKLLERIEFVRPHHLDNLQDCLDYADRMGYTDFSHSPDYAIAFLHFAEHFQLRSLWIDAFVHCVGMNDNLCLSHEFEVSAVQALDKSPSANIIVVNQPSDQGPHHSSLFGNGPPPWPHHSRPQQLPRGRAVSVQSGLVSSRSRTPRPFPIFPALLLRRQIRLLATTRRCDFQQGPAAEHV